MHNFLFHSWLLVITFFIVLELQLLPYLLVFLKDKQCLREISSLNSPAYWLLCGIGGVCSCIASSTKATFPSLADIEMDGIPGPQTFSAPKVQ